MKIPKKVTAGQAVQAQTINDLINSVQLLKDRRDFDEDSGNDDTITPHAFWADMEWQDPDADGYVAGKEMRATFTQGYVQCLITGNKIPVFRHPLEGVKQIEEDDFYELVVYTGGDGGVTAVRFVEGVAEGQTEIDDFDLQEIADAITEAEGAVPEELTAAIAAAAEDDLSGTKNRVKVVEFRREDDPGQDDLEPGEVATKHWEVDYWCKNDIIWGGAGGGGQCILGTITGDPENDDEDPETPPVKKKLTPGFISGGGSSEILVVNDLTPAIDDLVWVKVIWTADVVDDLLSAGGTMGLVTVETGTDVPDDTIPTESSTAGIAYIPLGGWISDGAEAPATPAPVWVNQGCGSLQVFFCPGPGFFFSRDNQVSE